VPYAPILPYQRPETTFGKLFIWCGRLIALLCWILLSYRWGGGALLYNQSWWHAPFAAFMVVSAVWIPLSYGVYVYQDNRGKW
jgi:hypothetical protein